MKTPAELHLSIDQLVIDGLDLPVEAQDRLQRTVTRELTRLLTRDAAQAQPWTERNLSRLTVNPLSLPADASHKVLGQQIAQAIYQGIRS